MRRAAARLAACCWLAGTASLQAAPPGTPAAPPPPPADPPPQRIELDPSTIRGNQELPKVLYIVPWKEPQSVEPSGKPLNSLLDEALAPVDREVFRRQVTYFDQLYRPSAAASGDGARAP